MMLFRRADSGDLDSIYQLAKQSGIGITTFPKDKALLRQRLKHACSSFEKVLTQPKDEYYLFVLEEIESKKLLGISGIEAFLGHDIPFYSYKISKHSQISQSVAVRTDYAMLNLVNDKQSHSEVCTLFLEPNYRHSGNGLLLSRARFLFIAQFPKRFAPIIIAEMRGISDELGNSPFWEHLGKHFFGMSFAKADQFTISTDKQFIADLMPKNPIYINLLALEAQNVIGKPHQSTLPAMNILLKEGFRYNNYIDIFDAGPTIEAHQQQIRTIVTSRVMEVKISAEIASSNRFLISNTQLNFKATINQLMVNNQQDKCYLNKNTAEILEVKTGDFVRIAPLEMNQ